MTNQSEVTSIARRDRLPVVPELPNILAEVLRTGFVLLSPWLRMLPTERQAVPNENLEQFGEVFWRLDQAFEKVTRSYKREDLGATFSEATHVLNQFSSEFLHWADLVETMLQEARQRGVRGDVQVKAAVLHLIRKRKLEKYFEFAIFSPLVIDIGLGWCIKIVSQFLDYNRLWEAEKTRARPKRNLVALCIAPFRRVLEGGRKILAKLAWWLVSVRNPLSRDLKVIVDGIGPDIETSIKSAAALLTWLGRNRELIGGFVEIVSVAAQEAELFMELHGREKRRYAGDMIMAFIEHNGYNFDKHRFEGVLLQGLIDLAIDSAVMVFNKRNVFEHHPVGGDVPSLAAAEATA